MEIIMTAFGSSLEWTACLIAAGGALIACRKGKRWIMLGLLAVIMGWLAGTAKGLLFPAAIGNLALWASWNAGGRWKWTGLALALGGAFASALLCWVFPLPEVPALSGPHPVGTLTFEVAAEGKSPALVAQVWYPAKENKAAPRSPWMTDPELAPKFPFHRQGKALARSRTGLAPSDASSRFPLIFYEHSWTGHRAENVTQVEDLTSHGFVVIAVDHPGQAGRVKYQDGTVVLTRLPGSFELTTESEVVEFEKLAEQCLDQRIQDLARTRQALARGAPALLAGRMSLERAGVFGFSFGGTSAIRLCAVDPFYRAGANEDGMFLGEENPRGPFLFFDEEMPGWLVSEMNRIDGPEDAQTRRSEMRIRGAMEKPDRFRVILDGTLHAAFTDRIFTCRIPWLARVGTRPSAEVHHIITSQLGSFFKRELAQPGVNPGLR